MQVINRFCVLRYIVNNFLNGYCHLFSEQVQVSVIINMQSFSSQATPPLPHV